MRSQAHIEPISKIKLSETYGLFHSILMQMDFCSKYGNLCIYKCQISFYWLRTLPIFEIILNSDFAINSTKCSLPTIKGSV